MPVEKVVKEILYVPILTDDPEALRHALAADLPEEVRDLMKISAKVEPKKSTKRGSKSAGTA